LKLQIKIKIQPNASENKILDYLDNYLKIKIVSPAIEGRANKTLIDYLSKQLGISKSSFKIIKGQHFSKKIIEISNLTEEKLSIVEKFLRLPNYKINL